MKFGSECGSQKTNIRKSKQIVTTNGSVCSAERHAKRVKNKKGTVSNPYTKNAMLRLSRYKMVALHGRIMARCSQPLFSAAKSARLKALINTNSYSGDNSGFETTSYGDELSCVVPW